MVELAHLVTFMLIEDEPAYFYVGLIFLLFYGKNNGCHEPLLLFDRYDIIIKEIAGGDASALPEK